MINTYISISLVVVTKLKSIRHYQDNTIAFTVVFTILYYCEIGKPQMKLKLNCMNAKVNANTTFFVNRSYFFLMQLQRFQGQFFTDKIHITTETLNSQLTYNLSRGSLDENPYDEFDCNSHHITLLPKMQKINFISIHSVLNTEVQNTLHEPIGFLTKTMKPKNPLQRDISG